MDYAPIDTFAGEYFFLSNFYPLLFEVPSLGTVKSGEHAYQAVKGFFVKNPNPEHEDAYVQSVLDANTPGDAKHVARRLKIDVPLWESKKVNVMRTVIACKFAKPGMKSMLKATSPHMLIEGNTWGDRIWGQVNGQGNNLLGVLLMEERGRD